MIHRGCRRTSYATVRLLSQYPCRGYLAQRVCRKLILDGSELNRPHMSELSHYEATAEGLEWMSQNDVIYVGAKDSSVNPKGPSPEGGM